MYMHINRCHRATAYLQMKILLLLLLLLLLLYLSVTLFLYVSIDVGMYMRVARIIQPGCCRVLINWAVYLLGTESEKFLFRIGGAMHISAMTDFK
jgi:hypothetical protein